MTAVIIAVLVLLFVQTLLPSAARARTKEPSQLEFLRGPRDDRPTSPVLAGRMERALRNLFEALPIFLTLALLAIIKDRETGWALVGAITFLAARLAYVPSYASGIVPLRSGVWAIGHAGLVMLAIGVLS